jgi:hypothetical protein
MEGSCNIEGGETTKVRDGMGALLEKQPSILGHEFHEY